MRRFVVVLAAIVIIVGVAVAAGFLAFRGVVGGELALKDSNAAEALVQVRSGEPSYTLVTAELGSVADPLENEGPDVLLLVRLDPQDKTAALVNVPSGTQVTVENRSEAVSDIAQRGDAALISALSTLLKIDISHLVKIEEGGLEGMVDALGGVNVSLAQEIDDPRAGSLYIPAGEQTLDGKAALTFLRATNLSMGEEDRLDNQLSFAVALIKTVFSSQGNFTTRLEAVDSFFQTDLSLGDIESINGWFCAVDSSDIAQVVLPGYFSVATDATSAKADRYIVSASDASDLFSALEEGDLPEGNGSSRNDLQSPSSFTLAIQNGTTIEGEAATMAALLKSKGFVVGDVGNAEQPVYEETLVVYRSSDVNGRARAQTLIDAIGVGRSVSGDSYYSFEGDILLIIGSDNKPVS